MNEHEKIIYTESQQKILLRLNVFFFTVFAWNFVDYGDEYMAFSNADMDGGLSVRFNRIITAGCITGFYSDNLEQTQRKIEHAGGEIVAHIFKLPGGLRFHFQDPNKNKYAVWSAINK